MPTTAPTTGCTTTGCTATDGRATDCWSHERRITAAYDQTARAILAVAAEAGAIWTGLAGLAPPSSSFGANDEPVGQSRPGPSPAAQGRARKQKGRSSLSA